MTAASQQIVVKLRTELVAQLGRVGRRVNLPEGAIASLCVSEALLHPDDAKKKLTDGRANTREWGGPWLDVIATFEHPTGSYLRSFAAEVGFPVDLAAAKLVQLMVTRQPATMIAKMRKSGTLPIDS